MLVKRIAAFLYPSISFVCGEQPVFCGDGVAIAVHAACAADVTETLICTDDVDVTADVVVPDVAVACVVGIPATHAGK